MAAAIVAVHLLLVALHKEFCLNQLTMSIYYAIVVIGLCLLMGYAGQVSLGHGAFFAIGGYTTAILTTRNFAAHEGSPWGAALKACGAFVSKQDTYGEQVFTASPWAAFIAAMVLTLVVATLIGYPALRLKGHYLAMATLGFGMIIYKIVGASEFTGAADGISSVPAWSLFGVLTVSGKSSLRVQNYYIASGIALVLIVLMWNLLHSRVGRALQAIHDRETAANAMGINTAGYKLRAFVASALLASIAGVFYTHYSGGISPSEASALKSVRYVALAAAGGMANLWGVAVMSIGLNFLSLRGWFGTLDNAVFGAILITIVSLAPEGPLKPLGLWIRRLFGRRPSKRSKTATAPEDDKRAAA
ncbi:MAG: branched-chain amino acid ABC transporter permease [Sulfuricella sp.]